ncbi:MAG: hypothetical protein ACK559_11260, partial [bacterium]
DKEESKKQKKTPGFDRNSAEHYCVQNRARAFLFNCNCNPQNLVLTFDKRGAHVQQATGI